MKYGLFSGQGIETSTIKGKEKHEYVGEVELLAEPKTQTHNADKQFVFLLRPV